MRGAMPSYSHISSWRRAGLNIGYIFMAWNLIKHWKYFPFFTFNSTYTNKSYD